MSISTSQDALGQEPTHDQESLFRPVSTNEAKIVTTVPNSLLIKGEIHGTELGRNATSPNKYLEDTDLILVIETGGQRLKLPVNSILLKNASRVFKAMLGPNFAEGRAFREANGTPTELELPDDDPVCFAIICSILYDGDAIILSLEIDPGLMLKTVMLIDKYDMGSRFILTILKWKDDLWESAEANREHAWYGAWISYWIRSEPQFYHFTRMLAKRCGSFQKLASELEDEAMGLRLCLAIEEMRTLTLNDRACRPVRGLCLNCFKTAKGSFQWAGKDCITPEFHDSEGDSDLD